MRYYPDWHTLTGVPVVKNLAHDQVRTCGLKALVDEARCGLTADIKETSRPGVAEL